MTVHRPGELALVSEQGVDVAPATAASLGVEVTRAVRREAPYTSMCIHRWNDTTYDFNVADLGQTNDSVYTMVSDMLVTVFSRV